MAAFTHHDDAQRQSPDMMPDHDHEKNMASGEQAVPSSDGDNESDTHKQNGVRNVEAVTVAWDKKMLWVTFVL